MNTPDEMNVIANDLETVIETWSDPGVYPSGAGGGPLPSHDYVDCVEGSVTVELTTENLVYAIQEEMWGTIDLPRFTRYVKKWRAAKLELADGKIRLTLEVEDFEADDVVDEPPEYEPDDIDPDNEDFTQ